jgi:uncharacterized membrane protein YedE/YeeE
MKYADPYVAGVGLGLVLMAAFVLTGHGLGASGAFAAGAAGTVSAIAPHAAATNGYFGRYLADGGSLWSNWLVLEIAGVALGAFLSAALAGRLRGSVDRGAGVTVRARLARAASGGALMGIGAVLARGCTSGLALSGGALLSVGSWAFMLSAFAAGFAAAPLVRRAWPLP